MPYLIDADWVIQSLIGYGDAARILQRLTPQSVSICWVTVAEVYE